MLTKNDVEILKEIFVTKEEFIELKKDVRSLRKDVDVLRIEVAEIKQTMNAILIEVRGMVEMLGGYTHRTEVLEHQFQSHLANHKNL